MGLSFDHLVLTVRDMAATERFYVQGLGMELRRFAGDRLALHFGRHKINLHPAENNPVSLVAQHPLPGTGDFCLLTDEPLDALAARMAALGYPVVEGPVRRSGARGPILSLYFRDPDSNLVEIATADPETVAAPAFA